MYRSSISSIFSAGFLAVLLTGSAAGGVNCLQPDRFELDVNGPDGLLSFAAVSSAPTTNQANDTGGVAGLVTLSQTTVSLVEGSSSSSEYTVAMSSAPSSDVVVTIAPHQLLNVSPGSLTFSPTNWEVPRTVRLTALENHRRDVNGITLSLNHALQSNDERYSNLNFRVAISITGDNEKLIFLTANTYAGSLTTHTPTGESFRGADEKCNTDPNKPAGSGYFMALISGQFYQDGTAAVMRRAACFTGGNCAGDEVSGVPTRDWVLRADTNYVRPDNTMIGRTGSARYFTFPLTNAFSDLDRRYWAGLTQPWTQQALGSTCFAAGDAWASQNPADQGFLGRANSVNAGAIADTTGSCADAYHLVCVEQ